MGLLIFVCVIYTELLQNCMMYQTAHGPCLSQALTTTTPVVENSEQETGEAIENGNLTPLATDIANISIQMKNINDRFTESERYLQTSDF
jgi:hypothetical protein